MADELLQLAASVEQALHVFYSGSDGQLKASAHQVLNEIRSSPSAGRLAWLFFSDMSKPSVAHFFAATALRNSISRNWEQMSRAEIAEVRSQLFKVLVAFGQAERYLHVQLCVTTAEFLLQQIASQNESGSLMDALKDLEDRPGWQSMEAYQHALLGLLTVLPEQFSSMDMPGAKRNVLRCHLQEAIPSVLKLLNDLLTQSSSSASASFPSSSVQATLILHCFTSWAKFGIPLDLVQPLLPTFFQATAVDTLFQESVDLLCEVIQNGDSYRFPSTVRSFMALTAGLVGQFQTAASQGLMDYCQQLSRIVTSVGENHCKLLVEWNTPEEANVAMQFLNFAVHCSTLPGFYPVDEECTDGMLYFWFRFYEEVEKLDKGDLKQSLWTSVFHPVLQSLLAKVQFPVGDTWTEMFSSHKETFSTFRTDAADTVMYISRLYYNECMLAFHTSLSHLLAASDPAWQPVEAIFFVLRTCSDTSAHFDELCRDAQSTATGPALLEQIFRQFLVRLPPNAKLQHTLFSFFCSYSDWLRHHADLVAPILSLLVTGLQEAKSLQTVRLAVESIWEMCSECQEHIVPYLDQLVAVCQSPAVHQLPRCRVRLYESACRIMSALPADHCAFYAERFVAPHVERLRQLATQPASGGVLNEVTQELHLLKAIFHRVDPECDDYGDLSEQDKIALIESHPIRLLVTQDEIWQVFSQVLVTCLRSTEVVQAFCEMLERLVITLQEGVLFRLATIHALLVQVVDTSAIRFSVDVTTRLMWFVSSDATVLVPFRQLLAHFAPLLPALTIDPSSCPDLTLSYVKLLSRVAKSGSEWVFSANPVLDVHSVLTFLQAAMAVPEEWVMEQACSALVSYITEIDRRKLSEQLWQTMSGILLGSLLSALLKSSPGRQCSSLSNVLFALYRHLPLQLRSALEAVFESIPPFSLVAAEDKQRFLRILAREKNNKRIARDGVVSFLQAVALAQQSSSAGS